MGCSVPSLPHGAQKSFYFREHARFKGSGKGIDSSHCMEYSQAKEWRVRLSV